MTVNGVEIPGLPNNLELPRLWWNFLSLADFAALIGKDPSRIRHDIANGKLQRGKDCMMYGKQWVINAPDAVIKLYGNLEIWNRYLYDCRNDLICRGIDPPKNIW